MASTSESQVRQFFTTLLNKEEEESALSLAEFTASLESCFPDAGWSEAQVSDCFESLSKSEDKPVHSQVSINTVLNKPDVIAQLFIDEPGIDIISIQRDWIAVQIGSVATEMSVLIDSVGAVKQSIEREAELVAGQASKESFSARYVVGPTDKAGATKAANEGTALLISDQAGNPSDSDANEPISHPKCVCCGFVCF